MRSKVSWEGMPLGKDRKVFSQSWRLRPKAAIWGKSSAPAMTAHKAMATMSNSRCFLSRLLRRGSRNEAKHCQSEPERLPSMTVLGKQEGGGSDGTTLLSTESTASGKILGRLG